MNIGRSTSFVFLARGLSAIITFIGIAYFANELGAAEIGIFFIFQASSRIIAIMSDFGLSITIEKKISEGNRTDEVFSTGIVMNLILVSIIILSIIFLEDIINEYFSTVLITPLLFTVLFNQISRLAKAGLRGRLRVSESAFLGLLNSIIWVGVGVVVISHGYGARGLAWSYAFGFIIVSIVGIIRQNIGFTLPKYEFFPTLAKFSIYSSISIVNSVIHNSMDLILIGFFLTSKSAGIYEVAWQVGLPVLILTNSISRTIFPQMSAWESSGDLNHIEDLISKIITPALVFVIPAIFGSLLMSKDILWIIYGEEFIAGWLVLIVIVAGKIPRAIQLISGKALLALNKPHLVAVGSLLGLLSNLILNVILIYNFGIVGAAVGTMIALLINMSIRIYYITGFISINIPTKELSWCIISSATMSIYIIFIYEIVDISSMLKLLLLILSAAIIYTISILYHPQIRYKFMSIIS